MSSGHPFKAQVARVPLKDRLVAPVIAFAENEATGGLILMASSVIALLWANLAPAHAYHDFWNTKLQLAFGDAVGKMSLHHFINDGFMALFFLLVGLEIKREFLIGELRDLRKASLSVFAAIGGMVVPAGIFLIINAQGGDPRGWRRPATSAAACTGPRPPHWGRPHPWKRRETPPGRAALCGSPACPPPAAPAASFLPLQGRAAARRA
jgi:hypothetical protein